ncbi:pickpocket protein 28-like isoform X2 [Zophobas morio]|uniref:pickpocket protein 28-like isoform X2 n=1 Tax=Zophobas morio TaxID=2755281 RepID=UPI003083E215
MRKIVKNIKKYFKEYCNSTSIHGFRYFAEERTYFEKLWWLIVFIISLGVCVLSIYMVYRKWDDSPVIVSFANTGTPIYKIPFPAITICPETKSARNKFNFTDLLLKKINDKNLTDSESVQFDYMSLICDEYLNESSTFTVSEQFYDFVDEVKPMFNVSNCIYRGKKLTCDKIFKPIFTEEGVCYTFNMLDRSEIFKENVVHYRDYQQFLRYSTNWSIEHGYAEEAGLLPYPRRALLAGAKNGFTFELMVFEEDLDYVCKADALQGYKVLVHLPTTFPTPSQEYFRVPLDQKVIAAIQPSMITTSESVRAYNQERRRCYFQTERNLQYFRIYNTVNCDIECLANYTLDWCGCVNFFMPRDNTTDICGGASLECTKEAERYMQTKNLKRKINNRNKSKRKSKSLEDCDCLPLCTDLVYDAETSQTDWDWKQWYTALGFEKLIPKTHHSSLTIYFKADDFITSERNEFYGPTDFLANFGGLVGLFTGVSVLSVLEILYFASVRLLCNKRLYGKWTGVNE